MTIIFAYSSDPLMGFLWIQKRAEAVKTHLRLPQWSIKDNDELGCVRTKRDEKIWVCKEEKGRQDVPCCQYTLFYEYLLPILCQTYTLCTVRQAMTPIRHFKVMLTYLEFSASCIPGHNVHIADTMQTCETEKRKKGKQKSCQSIFIFVFITRKM